jgi:CheY-like chemotaxis protein
MRRQLVVDDPLAGSRSRQEVLERGSQQVEAKRKRFAGLRVLLVEDDAVMQQVVGAMLGELGARVEPAGNGLEALARWGSEHDMVLMDCQMPEMDGYEATREIRRRENAAGSGDGRRVPIVAMTARAMAGDREECLAAGMDDHLTKPFTQEDLVDMIELWAAHAHADGEESSAGGAWPDSAHDSTFDSRSGDSSVLDRIRQAQRGKSPELLQQAIAAFCASAGELIAALKTSTDRGDAEATAEDAHRLKSISELLGAEQLADVCRQLERAANEGALESSPVLLGELLYEFDTARSELEGAQELVGAAS